MSPPGKSTRKGGSGGRKKAAAKPARSRSRSSAAAPARKTPDDSGSSEALEPEIIEPEIVEPEVVLDDDSLAAAELDELGSVEDAALAHGGEHEAKPVTVKPDAAPPSAPDTSSTALVTRDALGAYLAEIRKYPILSREEEHEIAVKYYETGDPELAYKLITSNLRLVVMVAREYQRAFHNLLDLVQEGNVGLLEAVKKFDPYRGVRLPSYAVWWIRAYVIRYVMNNFRLVKVGTTQAQRRLFFNLQKEKARLESEGFRPTAKLLAENLGVKETEVIEMDIRMGASEVSADAPVGPDSDTTMIDLLPEGSATAEDEVADRQFLELMKAKLAEFQTTLEGRDYEIFTERLLAEDPLTLQELGERYGVSRERVRQIEEALRKRLREFLVEQIRDIPELPGA